MKIIITKGILILITWFIAIMNYYLTIVKPELYEYLRGFKPSQFAIDYGVWGLFIIAIGLTLAICILKFRRIV